jgi:MerR family transcriptional regulator, light-induced transcriptional regulator
MSHDAFASSGAASAARPSLRSAAVAQMAGMPVSTLRIWEQRYRVLPTNTAPAKHRLYAPQDARRVVLLRQLTQHGHAISSIASMDEAQLQALAADLARETASKPETETSRSAKRLLGVVIIGRALAMRIQRPLVAQRLQGHMQLNAVFASIEEALNGPPQQTADLIIWHTPELQANAAPEMVGHLRVLQQRLQASRAAVVYRYAGSAVIKAFAKSSAVALREPPDDQALVAWLGTLYSDLRGSDARPTPAASGSPEAFAIPAAGPAAPRRFDDSALTAIASLSPSLACECPTHLAELLMQISSFEDYSAGCAHQSPEDAQLHAYLQQVAGHARVMFESALERVARHEGVLLEAAS